jgi:transposase
MSQRERDRLKLLEQVERGQIKQREAAARMGLSERGFRKLLARYRANGDRAVVHGLRGKPSKRRLPKRQARRIVQLFDREYADFQPTLAAEYLEREHSIRISRETLRQLLMREGRWEATPRKVRKVHVWRARRACQGELVQWDTSTHAWLEDRGPAKMYLVALIDDATGRLFARFVEADSTEENMRVLEQYLRAHGRPQAVYTDKAGLFRPTLPRGWNSGEPHEYGETQLGRALREMGIELILAHSPQAKGRVERSFGTLQDRLVKALRKAKVSSREAANTFLEQVFLPDFNQRFAVAPCSDEDAHRPVGNLNLTTILSHVETRRVANDYTIRWESGRWQIPKTAVRAGLRGSRVPVLRRLDGALMARIGEDCVELRECGPAAVPEIVPGARPEPQRHVPKPGQSRWMDGFRITRRPPPEPRPAPESAQLRSPSGLPPPD